MTPFPKLQGVASAEVTTLADVLPTVCDMAGLPVPAEVQGRSLIPAFFGRRGRETPLAYSETYYPRFHYGWSDLKSVQDARYKLILAPVPELYDVVADPREEKNLVYLEKKVYERMNAEAEAFIGRASLNAYETDLSKVDEETRQKLSALGYVGAFTDPAQLKGKKLGQSQGEDRRLQPPVRGARDGDGRQGRRGRRDHPGDHRHRPRRHGRLFRRRQHLFPGAEISRRPSAISSRSSAASPTIPSRP